MDNLVFRDCITEGIENLYQKRGKSKNIIIVRTSKTYKNRNRKIPETHPSKTTVHIEFHHFII